jgi:hypothetical protein
MSMVFIHQIIIRYSLNFGFLTKQELYHRYAASLPIIDYHCHLSPKDIAENRRFENLTQIWLNGDHYKWRTMRTCGVDERFITGNASDWEKFQKCTETVPKTLRNPLYHWIHLELNRPVGINIFASRLAFRRLRAFSLTLISSAKAIISSNRSVTWSGAPSAKASS